MRVGTGPFKYILAIHICFGTLALIIAPLAMITVKGGLWHRRWGKIYFWAMAGVAISAVILCGLGAGLFLFLIAILSFYLALTGYRVLGRKQINSRAKLLDYLVAAAMMLAGAGFIIVGLQENDSAARWVRIIFGFIGLSLGGRDIVGFLKPSPDPKAWFYHHMTRFLGAYIATVTAFSVVNFKFIPYFWRWLWPTAIGTLGISMWTKYYKLKFRKQTHELIH